MAERDTERDAERRGPDYVTLLFGLITLGVSTFVLTDGAVWSDSFDVRWLLAGGALVVGLVMLISSVRDSRRKR
ncbi:MAG TPA: hypothetical protein VFV67_13020 [Actinophytocola sp.]|uniref:hypothetical protein n=1 Tax=Actinophytocola sp. TaxID=1872138 RepID=UPI002DBA06F2|nr:hypothetical protein [Actinophytocola sp.]HEU5471568.1 hypothetical protein [Actinophytocola sp.]